jgi:hypothetical protein
MIRKDSPEWQTLLLSLRKSKSKSNRDVLCIQCWEILKYEECVKHKSNMPEHVTSILTSKEYASETKFISVARTLNKVHI